MAEKLQFVLYYYKTYPTFDVLGTQFAMARSKAHENLHKLSPSDCSAGLLFILKELAFSEFLGKEERGGLQKRPEWPQKRFWHAYGRWR